MPPPRRWSSPKTKRATSSPPTATPSSPAAPTHISSSWQASASAWNATRPTSNTSSADVHLQRIERPKGARPEYAGEIGAAQQSVGWTIEKDARDWWYHTSQGSQIMPYSWFVALEQFSLVPLVPVNFKPFLDRDHVTQFRLIPDA